MNELEPKGTATADAWRRWNNAPEDLKEAVFAFMLKNIGSFKAEADLARAGELVYVERRMMCIASLFIDACVILGWEEPESLKVDDG